MKKKRPLNFIIPLIIYPFDLMISIGQNEDQWTKSITDKWDAPTILEDIKKREKITQQGLSYIYTSERCLAAVLKLSRFDKNNPADQGSLAHEVFHICEFVLRLCGVELNSNSHEAYAYLVGYVTQEIYKKL